MAPVGNFRPARFEQCSIVAATMYMNGFFLGLESLVKCDRRLGAAMRPERFRGARLRSLSNGSMVEQAAARTGRLPKNTAYLFVWWSDRRQAAKNKPPWPVLASCD